MTAHPDPVEDARGLLCPLPVIRLADRLRGVPLGAAVLLLADDPQAEEDVRLWAKGQGHEVLETAQEGRLLRIRVRRGR
jgi:TusA-related sulfurtransferase